MLVPKKMCFAGSRNDFCNHDKGWERAKRRGMEEAVPPLVGRRARRGASCLSPRGAGAEGGRCREGDGRRLRVSCGRKLHLHHGGKKDDVRKEAVMKGRVVGGRWISGVTTKSEATSARGPGGDEAGRTLSMLSQLPVQRAMPSDETPRQLTRFSWPARTPTRSPLSVSQTLQLKSS